MRFRGAANICIAEKRGKPSSDAAEHTGPNLIQIIELGDIRQGRRN